MDNNNEVQENENKVVIEEQAVKPEKPKKKGRLTWSGVLLGILIGILLMFIPTVIICLVNILSISSLLMTREIRSSFGQLQRMWCYPYKIRIALIGFL